MWIEFMTDPAVPSNSDEVESTIGRTSSTLLARARASDQVAWQRLVHLYSPLLYGWCRRWGLQEADAADVGQDVFKAVAQGLAAFQPNREIGSFRGWLRTITHSKVVDFLRARQKGVPAVGGSDAHKQLQQLSLEDINPDDAALSEELQILYQRALEMIQSEFNEVHWQAFRRTTVDQQPAADVARELGITRDVVYNARSRILRRLREEFADVIDLDLL